MSRKITIDVINALTTHTRFSSGNTSVTVDDNYSRLWLHGYNIAKIVRKDGRLYINPCGFATATTKERLNGLPNVSIKPRAGVWYLNGSDKPMKMNDWTLIE